MNNQRSNRHGSNDVHELFDEDTAQVGSLADIVDEHAGDSTFLTRDTSAGGADSGEADFAAEMNPRDPASNWEEIGDEFPGDEDREDPQSIGETDITGTAAGIARGFGSHLPQDLGSDGFQIEEIPRRALPYKGLQVSEELDDYDDDDPNNGKYDPRELEQLSIPGTARVRADDGADDELSGQQRYDRAVTSDEDVDSGSRQR